MPQNLFAACRENDGQLIIKRIRVTQPLQKQIKQLFLKQEQDFLKDTEELDYNGGWKPEPNEILTINPPADAAVFFDAIAANIISLPDIDAKNISAEGIRALFICNNDSILVQHFTKPQILSQRFSLMLDKNTFKRLEEPAIAFDVKLACVISDSKVKFKSFHILKQIFDIVDLYQEATDKEIEEFSHHKILDVDDEDQFKENADQICRKLIYAINQDKVLDNYSVDGIIMTAKNVGLGIIVKCGRILIPADRKSMKHFLRFLNDGVYKAPLSEQGYVTNSKRKIPAA